MRRQCSPLRRDAPSSTSRPSRLTLTKYVIPIVEGVQRIEIKNTSITTAWRGKLRLSLWEPDYAGVYLPYSS